MMKRIFLTLIAVSFISAYLYSCSSNQEQPADSDRTAGDSDIIAAADENVETIPEVDLYLTDYLPERDYDGYEFTIIMYEDHISGTSMYIAEEEMGEVLNDAMYIRNTNIEDRFNIKINGMGVPWGETTNLVRRSVQAGDHSYDLLALHIIDSCVPLFNGGLIYNWLDVPDINLDKPWYNQSIIDLVEMQGFLPYLVGDFNYGSYPFTYGMIFNKDYIPKYALENPYDLVRSGDWTLDKFTEMVKMFSEDVNGDGMFDERDSYGYVSDFWLYHSNFIYATGNLCVQKTADNQLELVLYNEKTTSLIERLYDIIYVGNNTFQYDIYGTNPLTIDQNRSFIQALWLYDLPMMRSMEANFGIIPYPKWDGQQENYLTSVDARGGALALPVNSPDIERSGIIVEALSAESRRLVVPAYYDVSLSVKDARDEESREMLDILFAGRVYDIGYIYDSGMYWLTRQLLENRSTDFTSLYERNEAQYQRHYDRIAEQYAAFMERE